MYLQEALSCVAESTAPQGAPECFMRSVSRMRWLRTEHPTASTQLRYGINKVKGKKGIQNPEFICFFGLYAAI